MTIWKPERLFRSFSTVVHDVLQACPGRILLGRARLAFSFRPVFSESASTAIGPCTTLPTLPLLPGIDVTRVRTIPTRCDAHLRRGRHTLPQLSRARASSAASAGTSLLTLAAMAAITASIQAVATPKVAVKADARKSVKAVASLKPATAAKVVLSNNVEADSMQVRRSREFRSSLLVRDPATGP